MKERIAIISGFRSAMGKAGGAFKNLTAHDLGAKIAREVLIRSNIDVNLLDEVIIGNVSQPAEAANIARVIALKAGVPESVPAFTVHRNCASGMEAITSAASKINNGEAEIILAGGVESMSNIPLMFNKKMVEFFSKLMRAKKLSQKICTFLSFRLSFLSPIIGLQQGLTDPISGLIMGNTAENIANDFKISRQEQDEFALKSHQKASKAIESGIFAQEIIPVYNEDKKSAMIDEDEGVRKEQKISDLEKLKPYFDRNSGTVTVGNSSQITDGAAFVLLISEKKAKQLKKKFDFEILGYLTEFAYAGLDPSRMGLGPVFATKKLLDKSKKKLSDIDLIEINEAFAAQVIGCQRAFADKDFCQKHFNMDSAIGKIDDKILNVNGGAVALGHPVGMSGTRIIIHLLRELNRRNKKTGIATLCIGGGQGGACLVETS
jgi:acetyl-CoA C-acetyltransferase